MRWSVIVLVSLALGCSKKETEGLAEAADTSGELGAAEAAEAEGVEPSSSGSDGEPAAEQPSLPPELEGPTPPLGEPPTIEVLDPGEEPRQVLAWAHEPGAKRRLTVKVGSNTGALIQMVRVQSPPRTETYRLAIESKPIESTGALRMTFTIERAKAKLDHPRPQDKDEHLKSAAATMRGVSGSYSLTPSGHMKDFRIDLPPEASRTAQEMGDSVAWAFMRMYPVLPKEPIGQGARWTVHRGVEQGGIQVNELSTFRVTKLDGGRVELGAEVEQVATKQEYTPPGNAEPVELSAMWATAEGTVALDLSEPTPTSASMKADIVKNASKRPKGQRQVVPMTMQTMRSLEIPSR